VTFGVPRRIRPALAVCAVAFLGASVPGAAEQAQAPATLSGRVVDSRGDGMPAVSLTLTNATLSLPPTVKRTDLEGQFVFASLPPGDGYEITASVPDYATVVAGPLRLTPATVVRIVLTLEASSALQETVRVEARGAIVDLAATSTGTTYNAEFIEGLPLVGRQFEDILTLAPGVTDADGDGTPNVHGARETSFQLRLDGTNVSNPLTGLIGQNVNIESIEEVEMITTGASAEFGRASGGFGNAITKSGGNDFAGSLKLFYRSDFLDGDGANDEDPPPEFTDTNVYLTAGGPLVKDHFWYFTSIEGIDEEIPVIFAAGGHAIQDLEGWLSFGKLTWQATQLHRLALQVNYDPLALTGNNVGPYTSLDTDYRLSTGGPLVQLTWSAILSPQLLLNSIFSHMDGQLDVQPLSGDYRDLDVDIFRITASERRVGNPCMLTNCFEDPTIRRFVRRPPTGGRNNIEIYDEVGPWNERYSQDLDRTTLRSDLAYTLEDIGGQHTLKSGFEAAVESYAEDAVFNPVAVDKTCSIRDCPTGDNVSQSVRVGTLLMDVYGPTETTLSAEGLSLGVWAQDSWKPKPGLAINAGLRFDTEDIDTSGRTYFDPLEEAKEALAIWDLWCDAAGHQCESTQTPGRRDGNMPYVFPPPPGHPALAYDLNGDGLLELAGEEGAQLNAPYTRHEEWVNEPVRLKDSNIAPRLSLSWDPWEDGRTKLFGSYGVFYDRIFLGAVTNGQLPETLTARWDIGIMRRFNSPPLIVQATPGAPSQPLLGPGINQVDPDLTTPYTIEWTAGFERELAPEWSIGLTYISRRGEDLLQDVDVNHVTCDQFDEAFGVDPYAICGDGGALEQDKFGTQNVRPNGAPDLYVHNPYFNRVLEVGNVNASEYTAWELILRKRLHHNWQMQLGYTWSEARGDAEEFDTLAGNDVAYSDAAGGYLSYDQRHVVKWQGVAHLTGGLVLGGALTWSSGLPYSFIGIVEDDHDDQGNFTLQRVYSVTGEKNDQRNDSVLTVDGRIEKRFTIGRVQTSAFIEGENLLDSNDLRFLLVDAGDRDLDEGAGASDRRTSVLTDATRSYGRRWEIGAAFFF